MKQSRSKSAAKTKKNPKKGSTRKPTKRTNRRDPDALTPDEVAWDRSVSFDVDPRLAEAIRSRSELKQITLRIGVEQIEEARRVSSTTGVPYQTILRRWLAEGASLSRSLRRTG